MTLRDRIRRFHDDVPDLPDVHAETSLSAEQATSWIIAMIVVSIAKLGLPFVVSFVLGLFDELASGVTFIGSGIVLGAVRKRIPDFVQRFYERHREG